MVGSDTLVYRLLYNLTENGIKYNRPGGKVLVTVSRQEESLFIQIADEGCGIPKEYQKSIFHPFFRVDKSRSREYGGVGLGLSLAWEIVTLHGGSIWVQESAKDGTVIAVKFPQSSMEFDKNMPGPG